MTFLTCPDRDQILACPSHVLVTGGPGCGKTTVALRKALLRINAGLLPGQKVLFLSFSRAAVARIEQAARRGLRRDCRQRLDIQTFHSFCWQLVRGHGYLLGALSPIQLLPPHDERALRNGLKDHDPAWDSERERMFVEDGKIAFDLFAPKALQLLQSSTAFRKLVANRYPLIIVDEAQDTGTDQWGCVELLANHIQVVCLADLEQQIYEFRRDVSPNRLQEIVRTLTPLEIDLGIQNNRSPGLEIIKFGNDILANTPRGSAYLGVSHLGFTPHAANRDQKIRAAIGMINQKIISASGTPPESIGFLTNWGRGVSIIARALQGSDNARGIPHRVVMDETDVLLATRVIALCLEPICDVWVTLARSLDLIADLYRARGNLTKANQLSRNSAAAVIGQLRGNAKCAKSMKAILEHLEVEPFVGNPGKDWLRVRKLFEQSGVAELKSVAGAVIYLMGFNRGRRISDALAEIWQRSGKYVNARAIIEAATTEDQILGSDVGLSGINVMTLHKSKGKEFDGVIILHLGNISPLSPPNEPAPQVKSRRLLRVGITRAKSHVLLITDVFSPCPMLHGHNWTKTV